MEQKICAVVLAAGQSRRMGQPKMVLPWADRTVIEQVTGTLLAAGLEEIAVVVGGAREQIEQALREVPVRLVINADYQTTEMLSSIQCGLQAMLGSACSAALIALGDQPSISADVVRALLDRYQQHGSGLVVPSYQNRRGHPWLIDRSLWQDVFNLSGTESMRDFFHAHHESIDYVVVNTPSVIQDLDTPEDYARLKPANP